MTAIKPPERHGMEAFRFFCYDPDHGTIMGRTPKSWALITIFYIIYYCFLAGFWALMFIIFWQTVDETRPKWVTDESIIGTSPGLGMRPIQHDDYIDSSMIVYNKESKQDTQTMPGYGGWVDRANQFLKPYRPENKKSNLVKCGPNAPAPEGKVCDFDISTLGPCATGNLGYDTGSPCIYLKLNRIFGLQNTFFNDTTNLPKDMPDELKAHIKKQTNKNQVWVSCTGEYPADFEGMKAFAYYPASRGFPSQYFPYEMQDGYLSPVVAVQIKKPRVAQLIHIECRAWAQNIGYDTRDRIGISHFELLVHNSLTANPPMIN